jgi:hypothetical protein
MLESELGRRTISATLELARRALGREGAAASAPPRAVTPVANAPERVAPLIGREPERRALADLVESARVGGARSVLVLVGEPGVGKSRLLDELAAMVAANGGSVLRGRGFEAERVRPYGAWIDAMRASHLPDDTLAPLVRGAGDRARLLDAVVEILRRRPGPALIVLDDAQWIDEASIALLHFAARELADTHVLFAFAARPGELGDNPAALRLVRSLARERRALRIDLDALDAASTAELLRAHGHEVDAARVHEDSGGNPLYTLEIARALARGAEPLDSLDEILRDRLEVLEPAAREIVGWASAFGGGFALDVLQQASGTPQAELLVAIDQLHGHGFVRPRTDASGYDFAHDLVRAAAYRSLAEPRRRLLHLHIARVLHAVDDAEGTFAGDVARHAALGGAAELCARACLIAARRSLRLFAASAATELAERGLRQIDRMSGPERLALRVELLRVAIFADTSMRLADVHEREMERAIVDARAAGMVAEVTAGLHALAVLHHDRGDFAKAEVDTLRAEQVARAADDIASMRSLARTGMCLAIIERDLDRAAASTTEARRRADALGVEPPELLMAEGLMLANAGEDAAAVPLLERAQAMGEAAADHYIDSLSLLALARIALDRGDFPRARSRAAQLRAVAARLGEGSEGPIAVMFDALARAAVDEPGIDQPLAAALQTLRDIDNRGFLAYALGFAAALDLGAGRLDRARERAAEALASATQVHADNEIARAQLVLSRIAAASEDDEAARSHREAAIALAESGRLTGRMRHAVLRGR